MRVLVLAWDVEGGARPHTALAGALARAGHEVRLVTRLGRDGVPPVVDGVEVHAVADAPPIVPAALADPLLDALGFAGRATAVAVRRLEERPTDVVHAEGWATGPVVAGLRRSHGVRVVAALEPWERQAAGPRGEIATALAQDADAVVQRAVGPADGASRLPIGTDLPQRRPGPPPRRGPVHLVVGEGEAHRTVAAALRGALDAPRRITGAERRRPVVSVVLDPHGLAAVARAFARGVPVVTVPGPTGNLVAATGAGLVVGPATSAVARGVAALVADTARCEDLGAAGTAAAAAHGWDAAAAAWTATATAVADGGRLHAAG